jgi:hypothetical protein
MIRSAKMKPIKPKYADTVSVEWNISKKSKAIISEYSKYTKYDEDELVNMIIEQVLEDTAFVDWLKSKRYTRKINKLIFGSTEDESSGEVDTNEINKEDCDF